MLKLINCAVFISCLNFQAQNIRFIYNYKSIKDSTKKELITDEIYYLDTFKTGSKFYNYEELKQDSLAKINGETAFSISDKVFKTYPKYNVTLISKVDRDVFQVEDERPIIWKISPESVQIGSWKSQKATTIFAGRKWTAWFSTDIPIQDGPYKFHGLPGLITKIEDETKSHVYELKAISQLKNSELGTLDKKPIIISRENFIKAFKSYRNDPMKSWREMGIVTSKEDLSPDNEFLKNMSENKKKQIASDNNILEFDLLKR